jgi:hypothetical protein
LLDGSDIRCCKSQREEEILGNCRSPAITRVDEGEYCSTINRHLKVVAIDVGLVRIAMVKTSGVDGRPDQVV